MGDDILQKLLGKGLKDSAIIGEVRDSDLPQIRVV
jgi:hypothetical protein